MKESAIAGLFRNPPSREVLVVYKGEKYEEAKLEATLKQRALLDSLSIEQRKLFDEYEDRLLTLNAIEEDENFYQGFGLGIRVASEAFLTERKD